ncbi:hypothetical protein ES705_04997 [subsurface metagenome]
MRKLDVGGINYRKEIWAILKNFRDSEVMTLEEVTDRIMAISVPEEERIEAKKQVDRQKKLF